MPLSLPSRLPGTDGPANQPIFTVKVDGQALARKHPVLSVRVQHEVNRISTAHLVLQDGDAAKSTFALSESALFVPGATLEITAGYMGRAEKSIFKGLVVKHAIEGHPGGSSRLVITAKDAFVKTTLATRRRYFSKQTDSQVAQTIVGDYDGLSVKASPTSIKHPELLQYDATDWDFLRLRAAANGLLCLLDNGKLTLTKPELSQPAVLALQYGATLYSFDAEMDARDQASSLKATAWDLADGKPAEVKAAEPPADSFGDVSARKLAGALGQNHTLYYDGPLPTAELQAWADAALLRHRMAKIRGRVQFDGNAAVKPGTVIELSGLGKHFTGKAYVTGVSHRLEHGTWRTDAQLGLAPRAQTPAVPENGAAPLSPPAAAGLVAGVQGLQIGVVTALAGDEAGEERIAVRLPLVDPTADGTRARLVSLDAGKERGFFFRPEVGDEVVVGFLHGDPREAIVLGALHGSRHPVPAPFKTDDANPLKGFVSRSKLQVVFDDEKKTLTLSTPGGGLFCLDDDAKSLTLQDQNGNKIVLSDAGISLESSKALTLKGSTDATLDGQNVTLTAQAQLKASGSGGAELSSSATAVLKGATVMIN